MDMLRFDRFTAGRYWVDDYGYPNKVADFRAQLAYSPYHNIKGGRDYPAVLATTADMTIASCRATASNILPRCKRRGMSAISRT